MIVRDAISGQHLLAELKISLSFLYVTLPGPVALLLLSGVGGTVAPSPKKE